MKKDKKAIALSYDADDIAPKIAAKGQGKVAENILQKAEDHNIPIYEDEKLAKILTQIDIGDNIPEELYEIIAQILIFITDVDVLSEKLANNG